MKCTQDNVTLLFFPDFSPATAARRKSFIPFFKKMTALGLQPFLIYPAVIKPWHKGEQRSFNSPQKAEDFISSLSGERWPPSLRSSRRGLMAGMEMIPAAREKMVAGWTWIPVESLFFLSLQVTM